MSDQQTPPESLIPYEDWMEQALRQVVLQALAKTEAEGLPGGHHFYITFRTDHPAVVIPPRLRTQYPHEMTIVLQHQFEQLSVDREAGMFSVRLSFGNVPATLAVPLEAVTGFADPHVRFALQFRAPVPPEPESVPTAALPAPLAAPVSGPAPTSEEDGDAAGDAAGSRPAEEPQVVSLDAFRRRSTKD